jgi:hypothetical protein
MTALRRDFEIEAELGLPEGFLRSRRQRLSGPPFFRCGERTILYSSDQVRDWLERCRCDVEQPRQAVGG